MFGFSMLLSHTHSIAHRKVSEIQCFFITLLHIYMYFFLSVSNLCRPFHCKMLHNVEQCSPYWGVLLPALSSCISQRLPVTSVIMPLVCHVSRLQKNLSKENFFRASGHHSLKMLITFSQLHSFSWVRRKLIFELALQARCNYAVTMESLDNCLRA